MIAHLHATALALVDVSRPLLVFAGADYPRLRAILSAKIRTDLRPRQGTDGGFGMVAAGVAATMCFELVVGLLLCLVLRLDPPVGSFTALVQLCILGTIAFPLLMDFDAVLIGSHDEQVLESQPVDERTLLCVRVVHSMLYVLMLTLPLALPPLVFGSLSYPVLSFAPTFVLCTVLAAGLAVAVVTGLFGIGLRLLGPRRFRSTLLSLQVGTVVLLIGTVQLAAVTGGSQKFFELLQARPAFGLLVPPLHFGALMEVAAGSRTNLDLLLAACALLLAPVTLILALRALGSSGLREVSRKAQVAPRPARRFGFGWTRAGVERAGYAFTKRMLARERGYRMGAWTATAAYLPLGLGAQWTFLRGEELESLWMLCLPIYVLMAIAPTLLFHLRFSEDHEARWLLDGLSPRERAVFKSGAVKAVLYGALTVLAPLFLLAPLVAYGWRAVPQLVLAVASVLAWNLASSPLFMRRSPFSRAPSRAEAQGTLPGFLFASVLVGAAAALHVALQMHPWALGFGCALALTCAVVLHVQLPKFQPREH